MTSIHFFIRFSLCLTLCFLGLTIGCSKSENLRSVTGIVTYQGAPLEGAIVSFIPDSSDGLPGSGITNANGQFEILPGRAGLKGLKPGSYKVTVVKKEKSAPGKKTLSPAQRSKLSKEEREKLEQAEQNQEDVPAPKNTLPKKYGNPKTTPLEFSVENKSDNHFSLELKD
jgi:hypothetical protein